MYFIVDSSKHLAPENIFCVNVLVLHVCFQEPFFFIQQFAMQYGKYHGPKSGEHPEYSI